MVSQVGGLETTVTRSEAEALLLENNLIKCLSPRYNILFRDDKSYPYLVLTGHRFPRLGFHRGSAGQGPSLLRAVPQRRGGAREHPAHAESVPAAHLRRHGVRQPSRPCLLHQIRRCTAPCVGLIERSRLRRGCAQRGAVPAGQGRRGGRAARGAHAGRGRRAGVRTGGGLSRPDPFAAQGARDAVRHQRAAAWTPTSSRWRSSRWRDLREPGDDPRRHHLGDKNFFPQNAQDQDEQSSAGSFPDQHYLGRDVPPAIIVNRAGRSRRRSRNCCRSRRAQGADQRQPDRRAPRLARMAEKNAELARAAARRCTPRRKRG